MPLENTVPPENAVPLENAVLRTVLYGEVFHFAMTAEEIHHFLMHDEAVDLAAVSEVLVSAQMRAWLACEGGYVARKGREDLITLRQQREQLARSLWPKGRRCGVWLSRLPFVRMVGLTGALAMRNPSALDDDLDYLIVTQAGRVWLARAFAVLLVRLYKLRGIVICPNFVLAEDALKQNRQDLYVAHEVTQIIPVYDPAGLYDRLRRENRWVDEHLPNASTAFHAMQTASSPVWDMPKTLLEWLLGGRTGALLEAWERGRKIQRMSQHNTPAARLDHTQVKGHFNDHGARVLRRYYALLHDCGLNAPSSMPDEDAAR